MQLTDICSVAWISQMKSRSDFYYYFKKAILILLSAKCLFLSLLSSPHYFVESFYFLGNIKLDRDTSYPSSVSFVYYSIADYMQGKIMCILVISRILILTRIPLLESHRSKPEVTLLSFMF